MQYRKNRNGEPISLLGFGCMRFSRKGGKIDIEKAEKEVLRAYEAGVNYFDTAYLYPGNEAALGEILERNNLRCNVNVAAKLPQYLVKNASQFDKFFNEECRRLRTDYIDYYLMHMLTDFGSWEKLDRLGVRDWIKTRKDSGQIRQIGFSFHGNTEEFIRILNDYDWDFCLIQYNYMDVNTQAGREGLRAAYAKGIPVMIMEPLRGGKLVELLPKDARRLMEDFPVKRSPAEWAFRWLMQQPEVTCVLSGMNSMEMLEENIRIASEVEIGEFGQAEEVLIESVRDAINAKLQVNCTACHYCMPCPGNIDIPGTFKCFNTMYSEGKGSGRREFMQMVALQRETRKCLNCGKCETHCPQKLNIREELARADKALLPWYYRVGLKAIGVYKNYMDK